MIDEVYTIWAVWKKPKMVLSVGEIVITNVINAFLGWKSFAMPVIWLA